MEKNNYNIERVEFYYNGDNEKFDRFLSSAIKEYISTDKTLPDCENKKSAYFIWTYGRCCDMLFAKAGYHAPAKIGRREPKP